MKRLAFLLLFVVVSPAAAESRTWSDATGRFSVEAELIEVNDASQVVLKKHDGTVIKVPVAKLGEAERNFLRERAKKLAAETATDASDLLGDAAKFRVRIGLELTAQGDATGIVGAVAVPQDWPEQKVKIVEQDVPREVKQITYRTLGDGAKQMVMHVPRMRAGEQIRATVTFEVERNSLVAPKDVAPLRVPKRLDRGLRNYLLPGPLVESKNQEIIAAKNEAIAAAGDSAWEQVRAMHDLAIDRVKYENRDAITSAATALREGVGDCQELSSLFVAMCRAHGVPARCVWIPQHSYAEFYLEDARGRGQWYPVESTNKEHFGFLPRTEVILQKGDNFRVPELPGPTHYAQTVLRGASGTSPQVREIMELLPAE